MEQKAWHAVGVFLNPTTVHLLFVYDCPNLPLMFAAPVPFFILISCLRCSIKSAFAFQQHDAWPGLSIVYAYLLTTETVYIPYIFDSLLYVFCENIFCIDLFECYNLSCVNFDNCEHS